MFVAEWQQLGDGFFTFNLFQNFMYKKKKKKKKKREENLNIYLFNY